MKRFNFRRDRYFGTVNDRFRFETLLDFARKKERDDRDRLMKNPADGAIVMIGRDFPVRLAAVATAGRRLFALSPLAGMAVQGREKDESEQVKSQNPAAQQGGILYRFALVNCPRKRFHDMILPETGKNVKTFFWFSGQYHYCESCDSASSSYLIS